MSSVAAPPAGRAPMLTLDEAIARLLAAVPALPASEAELLPTFDALGRVLQEDVVSTLDVPPHDNSAMDGYALRCDDVAAPGSVLLVTQRLPAGSVGQPLRPGSAARIFTGASLPPGADAVVMQEQCEALPRGAGAGSGGKGSDGPGSEVQGSEVQGGKEQGRADRGSEEQGGQVRIGIQPLAGEWVRRRGEDVRKTDVVLAAGTRLTPQALGLAATVGAAQLCVARRPRVALFSTGDELAMPGEPLRPGAIYNSNRFLLRAAIQVLGCDCTDLGIVPDNLAATRDALRRAAVDHDLIVTSGGVSVGEEDHLRPAVQAEGAIDLWQIAVKPGKPLAFGHVRRADGTPTPIVGLPGNPVSSFMTFLLAVRPLLLRLQGATRLDVQSTDMRADFDWPQPDRRREFLRVRRNASGGLDLFPNQSSGVLTSVVWGDGVVDNPSERVIRKGDRVDFIAFSEWLS